MGVHGGPDIVTDGLVLNLDAGDVNSFSGNRTNNGSGTTWSDLSGNGNHGTMTRANTILLIHSDTTNDNTTFSDASTNDHTITVTNTKHSSSFAKFGATSMYFTGSVGNLTIPDHNDFDFGTTDDFTMEAWIYKDFWKSSIDESVFSKGTNTFLMFWPGTTADNGGNIYISGPRGYKGWNGDTFSLDNWHHVAFVRTDGTLSDTTNHKVFIDGTERSQVTYGTLVNGEEDFDDNADTFNIGKRPSATPAYDFEGYMDEICISNVARYSSNFTPPTKPFGPTFNTVNNGCLNFASASQEYVDLGNNFDYQGTTLFTIEAWVNADSVSPVRQFIFAYDTNATQQYGVGLDGNSPYIEVNGSVDLESSTTLSTSTWYNIVYVFESSNTKIYLNGALDSTKGSRTSIQNGTDTTATIGRRNYSGYEEYFGGKIANVNVYTRVLSSKEVLQNFNAKRSRFGV